MVQASKKVFLLVLVWWIANGLTSLYSKTELPKSRNDTSFLQMKWLDLTITQFLFGVIGSSFWIFFIKKKFLSIPRFRDWNGFVLILGTLVGHVSVNVCYTFVSSSATQVVRSSELIFMFIFLHCILSQKGEKQDTSSFVLFSILFMIFGTSLFVIWDITLNVWGILAAVASAIAFPLRNIALKNVNLQNGSPLETYFMLSFFGIMLLFPCLVVKLMFTNTLSFPLLLSQTDFAGSAFHCVYNIASISVLQDVSLLNHAILSFASRIFVITLNIMYFNLTMTAHMFLGFVITFSGLALYLFSHSGKTSLNKFLIFSSLKITPQRFFSVAGFLTLLTTLVYLTPQHEGKIKQYTSGFEVNPVYYRPSSIAGANRDISEILTTAWVFHKPLTDVFIKDIITAHERTGASIQVYCGTTKCMATIQNLKNPAITANFLVVPDVFGKSPLQEWGERHVLYKVLAGLHYEWYLTQALCLAHLWHYGGRFHLPSYPITQRLSDDEQENGWACMSLKNAVRSNGSFKTIRLHAKDQRVQQSINTFLTTMQSWNSKKTLPSMFQDTVWNAFSRPCPNRTFWCMIRKPKTLQDYYTEHGLPFHDVHFGTLSLDSNVGPMNRANIGDEIQGIAGLQFLPFIDFFLDREYQIAPTTQGRHTVFFNAWWGNKGYKWPPSENIDPIMLSIHTDKRFRPFISSSNKAIDFLKSKAPIGARDMVTKKFMDKIGVPSFFSGCMTLFMAVRKPQPMEKRGNTIYIADLSNANMDLLPERIVKKAKFIEHKIIYGWHSSRLLTKERFIDAYKILEKYSQAKVVITQRIHAALPCVAMGTPVIFFNTAKMPGGGGSTKKASDRVIGLVELFHSIDLFNLTVAQAKEKLRKFNWTHPPRNPNLAHRMQMVSSMWNIIRKNQAIYESARKFGMLPLTPSWLTEVQPGHVFHIIHDDTSQENNKDLNWYQWRCIESILRHHATAKLFVYSNTIEQSSFDVLTEVGYQVILRNYKMSDLIKQTPLMKFSARLHRKLSAQITLEKTMHEHGVLRLLLLYKYGGIYLAENTIVLKNIDISQSNVLSLDSESYVNPWMLNFEKNHKFLRDALEMFPTLYNGKVKPDEGKALLTKLWKRWQSNAGSKDTIIIAKTNNFYSLVDVSQAQYEEHSKIIKNEVDVIRIPDVSKCLEHDKDPDINTRQIKQGTICKDIFNEQCLFCSNQY